MPLPVEWANMFMNKDLTPGEGFLLIKEKIEKWTDEEAATVQPVLNWLLAAGCKAKVTHRSRTETPNTVVWTPTFPNSEEVKWAQKKMENIFGIPMGNREKQRETETMGKTSGSGIRTSTSGKKTEQSSGYIFFGSYGTNIGTHGTPNEKE